MSLIRGDRPIDAARVVLAPLVVTLDSCRIGSVEEDDQIAMFTSSGGATLFVASHGITADRVARHALVATSGSKLDKWHIARTTRGQPRGVHDWLPAVPIGLARFGGTTAVAVSPAGPVGIDVETIDRVMRNADVTDPWLGRMERMSLAAMPLDRRSIELTCHWVLKEAYGKAIGMGLDYDLASLDIVASDGQIVARGSTGRPASGYRFDLLRDGRLIFGLARSLSALDGQAVSTRR